ncbi:unnamed protein product [Ixodes hexagonus]
MKRIVNALMIFFFYTAMMFGILLLVPIRMSKKAQQVLFARLVYPIAMYLMNDMIDELRRLTVSQLNGLLSHDASLREQGALRVLEIGAGPGYNFDFMKRKVHYWNLDPNSEFSADLQRRLKRNPNVTMERYIQGYAEDMRGVPDDHFDAVLMTYVLCSAMDVEKVLAECKRVLAKGGRLVFAEHVAQPRGSWGLTLEKIVEPLWKKLSCGCHVTRRSGEVLAGAGFDRLELKELTLPTVTPLSLNVWGYAEVDKE